MTMDITAIILAIISFLSGLGWMLDRKKHRQEIESLKADNRQKDMNRRTSERRGQAGLTSSSSDATRPSPSKLGWRSLLPRLTCVLIGLSALCWTSCGSSRKATSSLQLTASCAPQVLRRASSESGLQETRDTVREQVMVAVHDTIREVTTITVQTNEAGD